MKKNISDYDWDNPANRNPLYDYYHDKFDWRDDEYCEYDSVVQLAFEDGVIAVDDDRFCCGANHLLKWLFVYIHTVPRGMHYARLILRRQADCVAPELIEVCESLLRFEWPTQEAWGRDSIVRSCRWPNPYTEYYYSPWNPIMVGGGLEMVKTNTRVRQDLKIAKARAQAQEVIGSDIPF